MAAGAVMSALDPARRSGWVARRRLRQRYRAGLELLEAPGRPVPEYATPTFDRLPAANGLVEVGPAELSAELLRAAILRSGCLLVRGLLDEADAGGLVEGIDRAYAARAARDSGDAFDRGYFDELQVDPQFDLPALRQFVGGTAGLLGADSPRVMLDVLDFFDRSGLARMAADYLGEPPAISVDKCLLRRVSPDLHDEARAKGSNPSAWHQDGAFLGEVRALNVWLALSRCGDEAPGLDIIPRRLDHIVPTGTDGAAFHWSVSRAVAEEAAGEAGIVRPIFHPGDVLLFDEMFLHSTAIEPGMRRPRYAVESWFFGASGFPPQYAPLAV